MWTKTLTAAGIALLSRVTDGKLIFTKAHAGAGQISDNQLVNAVAVSQYMRSLNITQITSKPSAVCIRLHMNNAGLSASFDMYQIGLYAKVDGDASDVLMYIMQSDTAEYVPSEAESPSYINDFVVQLIVSQTDIISAVIDPAGFVTIGQFNNSLTNKLDKIGDASNTVVARIDPAVSEKYPNIPVAAKLSDIVGKTVRWLTSIKADKVDKVAGKGLSTNDYTTAEKTKLTGIANNANRYVHPTTHPASMIAQDSTRRMVTDVQINTWNSKASTTVATTAANGLMSKEDRIKLDSIATGANNYTHPSTHPYSMLTGAPTSLPANGGTAAKVPWTGITGKPTAFPATAHTHDDKYAPVGYGLGGIAKDITGGDWNNAIETGWYKSTGHGAANTPLAPNNVGYGGGWIGECICYSPQFVIQIIYSFSVSVGRVYKRTKMNTVWTEWQPIEANNVTASAAAPTAFLGEGFQHQKY